MVAFLRRVSRFKEKRVLMVEGKESSRREMILLFNGGAIKVGFPPHENEHTSALPLAKANAIISPPIVFDIAFLMCSPSPP